MLGGEKENFTPPSSQQTSALKRLLSMKKKVNSSPLKSPFRSANAPKSPSNPNPNPSSEATLGASKPTVESLSQSPLSLFQSPSSQSLQADGPSNLDASALVPEEIKITRENKSDGCNMEITMYDEVENDCKVIAQDIDQSAIVDLTNDDEPTSSKNCASLENSTHSTLASSKDPLSSSKSTLSSKASSKPTTLKETSKTSTTLSSKQAKKSSLPSKETKSSTLPPKVVKSSTVGQKSASKGTSSKATTNTSGPSKVSKKTAQSKTSATKPSGKGPRQSTLSFLSVSSQPPGERPKTSSTLFSSNLISKDKASSKKTMVLETSTLANAIIDEFESPLYNQLKPNLASFALVKGTDLSPALFLEICSVFHFLSSFGSVVLKLQKRFNCLSDLVVLLDDTHSRFKDLLDLYGSFLCILQDVKKINTSNIQRSLVSYFSNEEFDQDAKDLARTFDQVDLVMISKAHHVKALSFLVNQSIVLVRENLTTVKDEIGKETADRVALLLDREDTAAKVKKLNQPIDKDVAVANSLQDLAAVDSAKDHVTTDQADVEDPLDLEDLLQLQQDIDHYIVQTSDKITDLNRYVKDFESRINYSHLGYDRMGRVYWWCNPNENVSNPKKSTAAVRMFGIVVEHDYLKTPTTGNVDDVVNSQDAGDFSVVSSMSDLISLYQSLSKNGKRERQLKAMIEAYLKLYASSCNLEIDSKMMWINNPESTPFQEISRSLAAFDSWFSKTLNLSVSLSAEDPSKQSLQHTGEDQSVSATTVSTDQSVNVISDSLPAAGSLVSTADAIVRKVPSQYYQYFYPLVKEPLYDLGLLCNLTRTSMNAQLRGRDLSFMYVKSVIVSWQSLGQLPLLTDKQIIWLYGLQTYPDLLKWAQTCSKDVSRELERIAIIQEKEKRVEAMAAAQTLKNGVEMLGKRRSDTAAILNPPPLKKRGNTAATRKKTRPVQKSKRADPVEKVQPKRETRRSAMVIESSSDNDDEDDDDEEQDNSTSESSSHQAIAKRTRPKSRPSRRISLRSEKFQHKRYQEASSTSESDEEEEEEENDDSASSSSEEISVSDVEDDTMEQGPEIVSDDEVCSEDSD